MFDQILIVCVGNVCRSPMGEAILKSSFPTKMIRSSGIGALVGEPAADIAIRLMSERGFDLGAHRARQIDEELMRSSDLVIVMELSHLEWIESRWPESRGRVYRLGHWSNFDVPDPYQCAESAFREALDLIDKGLAEWQSRL